MATLERVPANRLRPGDVLYACGTTCMLYDAKAGTEHVVLATSTRLFTVPTTTWFRRHIRSRRINMRPDLDDQR